MDVKHTTIKIVQKNTYFGNLNKTMTQLHPSISKMLDEVGILSAYSDVAFISAYSPNQADVITSGLERLVWFCLNNPKTPILFFSFLPINTLAPKDKFSVLKLNGISFIQLPCTKETIIKAAEKKIVFDETSFQKFAEEACKNLLKQLIAQIKHSKNGAANTDYYGNILYPLRMACTIEQHDAEIIQNGLNEFKLFMIKNNKMLQLQQLVVLINSIETNDNLLITIKEFYDNLSRLSKILFTTKKHKEEIVFIIDSIYHNFNSLNL